MRSLILTLLVVLASPAVTVPDASGQPAVRARAPRTILLVDDHDVLYRPGTERILQPPARHPRNPLIGDERSYERTVAYCSVHRDPRTGKYQLWYQAHNGRKGYLCYAVSDDGLAWTKPSLGLFDWEGSKANNIVLDDPMYGASVVFDAADPDPARRYKAAYFRNGMALAFSPDGVHWKVHPQMAFARYSGGRRVQPPLGGPETRAGGPRLTISDVIDVAYDPPRRLFMAYAKTWIDGPDGETIWRRGVVRTDSRDFLHWSPPRLVAWPDEHDDGRLAAGQPAAAQAEGMAGGGSRGAHVHSGPTFYHEGVYFSLLQVIDSAVTGRMPAELAVSRDGLALERPFRATPFLATDGGESFDSGAIWTNATPVVLDDEIRLYYGAYRGNWLTGKSLIRKPTGIGLAVLPRDRFAGIRATGGTGQVTLKPLGLAGVDRLAVNFKADRGSLRVELLDDLGYAVAGFTKADARPLTGDHLREPAAWTGKTLAELPPGRYSVRLHLEGDATVYALRLAGWEAARPRVDGMSRADRRESRAAERRPPGRLHGSTEPLTRRTWSPAPSVPRAVDRSRR
jgi:hypothetical protein